MAETVIKIIIGVMLLFCGVQDAMKKRIWLWFIIIGSILIGICVPFSHTVPILDRFGGIAVGGIVILISLATKGKIGLGDGILLCATGFGLGFWGNLELFAIALFMAAIVSMLLLILRLADRKKSIPFVPFLFTGYAFLMIVNMKGLTWS